MFKKKLFQNGMTNISATITSMLLKEFGEFREMRFVFCSKHTLGFLQVIPVVLPVESKSDVWKGPDTFDS